MDFQSSLNSNQTTLQTCLSLSEQQDYHDENQALHILELMVEDTKILTDAFPRALKNNTLCEHFEMIQQVQYNWLHLLNELIATQGSESLNEPMIHTMLNFANNLNNHYAQNLDASFFTSPNTSLEKATYHDKIMLSVSKNAVVDNSVTIDAEVLKDILPYDILETCQEDTLEPQEVDLLLGQKSLFDKIPFTQQ